MTPLKKFETLKEIGFNTTEPGVFYVPGCEDGEYWAFDGGYYGDTPSLACFDTPLEAAAERGNGKGFNKLNFKILGRYGIYVSPKRKG